MEAASLLVPSSRIAATPRAVNSSPPRHLVTASPLHARRHHGPSHPLSLGSSPSQRSAVRQLHTTLPYLPPPALPPHPLTLTALPCCRAAHKRSSHTCSPSVGEGWSRLTQILHRTTTRALVFSRSRQAPWRPHWTTAVVIFYECVPGALGHSTLMCLSLSLVGR